MDRAARSVRRLAAPVVAIILSVVGSAATGNTADIFLDVPGIPGESTAAEAPGEIEVLSFQFSVVSAPTAKPAKSSTACGGTEKAAKVNEITLTKNIDKATPKLAEAASKGEFFPEVEIHFVTATTREPYLKYKLSNAVITAVRTTGANAQTPAEVVVLAYQTMEMTYVKPGDPATTTTATWDACIAPGS